LLFFVLIAVTIFLMQPLLPSSSARPQETERVFDNTIPKSVPIEFRIKKEKEKSFKDLNNEKWVRELEFELTNTGDKKGCWG